MYAVVKDSGQQFIVREGDLVALDRKPVEAGEAFHFSDVLLFHDEKGVQIGEPSLPNVLVKGKVERHFRDKKCIVYKFKRRKKYRRKQGHRQEKTLVKIQTIETKRST